MTAPPPPSTTLSASSRRSRRVALFTWLALALALCLVCGFPTQTALRGVVCFSWTFIVALASSLHALFDLAPSARRDEKLPLVSDDELNPSRDRTPVPVLLAVFPRAVVVTLVAGGFGTAVIAFAPAMRVLFVCAVLTSTVGAVWLARQLAAAPSSYARRTVGRMRLVLVETALPAAFVSAPFGVLVAAARLDGGWNPGPGAVARHLAISILLYASLLSVGAFIKIVRERSTAMIAAPKTTTSLPSAVAIGAVLAIVVLAVLPKIKSTAWSARDLMMVKGALSFGAAILFASLGAMRALSLDDEQVAKIALRTKRRSTKSDVAPTP